MLFGVTVLTSFAAGEMPGINEEPRTFATSLAGNAHNWGLNGVVCSGQEVAGIKLRIRIFLRFVPASGQPGKPQMINQGSSLQDKLFLRELILS